MSLGKVLYRCMALVTPSDSFWSLVDSTGIVVFVGPNGSGKSLCAVAAALSTLEGRRWTCFEAMHHHHHAYADHAAECDTCLPPALVSRYAKRHDTFDAGSPFCAGGLAALHHGHTGERLVYSTVVLTGQDGEDHPRFRPLIDYRQLLTIEHSDVLFDEVAGVSDASESGAIPVQVINWLHTLRKADVRLRVTTPAYSRCSKPIRQVAQLVVDARSFFPERRVEGRLWRPRQGFLFSAYDAFTFEDFTAGGKERLTPAARASLWRPGHPAESAYDTLGQVLALGHVTEHGLCSACGGSRSRPKCACPSDHIDGPTEVVETVSSAGTRTRTLRALGSGDEVPGSAAVPPAAGGVLPRQPRQRRSGGVPAEGGAAAESAVRPAGARPVPAPPDRVAT